MEANARLRGAEDNQHNPENRQLTAEEEEAAKKGRAAEKKTWGEWARGVKLFLWNPETRQFMGRTGQSWALIILFYLVLYTFLAGMFSFGLYVMLLTMSPYTPTYRDRVAPPGVMIRPYVDNTVNIAFNISRPHSWQRYVDNLEAYLQDYNDAAQESKNIMCNPGRYFFQEDESKPKKACQFKRSVLSHCSGLVDKTFGYSTGKPCILLKMNRIVGYKPGYGTPVTVTCRKFKGDDSPLRGVEYYPSNTFNHMYFPYYGKQTHGTYAQPLVAMHFTNVTRNKVNTIQCQLNGKGIINDYNSDRFLGRIIFMLQVGN
ncbi:protein ATP1B4 [Anolis carolinensis]|uniref:Sodium/potassium-transporting ATPase subunit beta n=1 Tax=Anolis carolinensis TaxID=28377 RepID=H9G817_ANOCA|nr:PREDICTED: protein ATP1B4 [Anolis carolinensis]|eukprot:XP_008121800.1 PREDICTED: protein ATP1B4 [Anolis carolinensis]